MRAAVIGGPNQISVERVPDPSPQAGEVVVRVHACGICGTDIHVLKGEFSLTRYPIIPGHEFCGR
jgi:D-arabinose 1-dehydrogenase-like Zn-dependent alcohol dehydrogenase